MSITIAIPTRNRSRELSTALHSIVKQGRVPEEVIVVDDSDTALRPLTEMVARESGLLCRVISKDRPGLAASRNVAADAATGSVVLYLDDDVVLEAGYVRALLMAFDDPGVLGAGGVIVNRPRVRLPLLKAFLGISGNPDGRVLASGWSSQLPSMDASTQFLSGCNMAFRTDLIRKYRFDERQFHGYGLGEDLEFSHRLWRAERGLRIVATARLWHYSSPKWPTRRWGRREVLIRPTVAGPRFSSVRFAAAGMVLAVANLVHGQSERARGNAEGVLVVLRDHVSKRSRCPRPGCDSR